jgi:hypothetical protein
MKRNFCIGLTALAVAVLAGSWLMGDDKKPDDPTPPKIKGQLPAHYKQIGLAEVQIQDIYRIQSTNRTKIAALQQQIDDLKKTEHQEVENVLTNDQKMALAKLLVGDLPEKDKPAPTDKPALTDKDKLPSPGKDKPAPTEKDKLPSPDKDKPAPPKDK